MNRIAVGLAVIGLVIGGLVGYLWWGQPSQRLNQELAQVQTQLGDATRTIEDLSGKLKNAEAQIKMLGDELTAERELRQRYEAVVGRGRK